MRDKEGLGDYVIRVHDDPAQIDAQEWDTLLDACGGAHFFLRRAYLLALHRSGSAVADTGWMPQFLTAWQGERLRAALPLYLKSHSYGEYVFDRAWADAHERHGLPYYPKLTAAIPFTPVPGPRLLAFDATGRLALLRGLHELLAQSELSSAHLLFLSDTDRASADAQGWLLRNTVQFHWHNRTPEPYGDFGEFLAQLQRDKRKKIAQERRKVTEAGIRFEARHGAQISRDDWDFFYRCYVGTYRAHRSTPYLTRAFFAEMAQHLPQHWLMFVAYRGAERIASSLVGLDPQQRVAYGRYWGCVEHVPCLHFEACYYQPLQWCIEHHYLRFEGGAQGEHKMARGLLPVTTWSAHWLRHPAFADAVAHFLQREGHGIAAYVDELRERNPFRSASELNP
jgi:uncharacterized protein